MKRHVAVPGAVISLALLAILAILLPGFVLADDGRINLVEHLGGRAVYCVDENKQPDVHYDRAGILVLSSTGVEELFVPNARVIEVGEPAENTLLGESNGLALYRLGGFPWYFQLNGVDEHGNPFVFQWLECDRSAPAQPTIEPTPTCEPYELLSGPAPFAPYDPCCPMPSSFDASVPEGSEAPSTFGECPIWG
jgi:hypothetical protein